MHDVTLVILNSLRIKCHIGRSLNSAYITVTSDANNITLIRCFSLRVFSIAALLMTTLSTYMRVFCFRLKHWKSVNVSLTFQDLRWNRCTVLLQCDVTLSRGESSRAYVLQWTYTG